MSQSALLVGLLAAAFLLYVAAKGRLPVYTQALLGPAPKQASSGGSSSDGSNGILGTGLNLGDVATVATLVTG